MMCPDGYSAEVPIALWQTRKVYKSKVKMQTTSASVAWLFLQENVQVQYLQKIALRAENKRVQSLVSVSTHIIFCVSNFLLPLRQHIFRIERRAIEAQRLQSIFTLSLFSHIIIINGH